MKGTIYGLACLFWDKRGPGLGSLSVSAFLISFISWLVFVMLAPDDLSGPLIFLAVLQFLLIWTMLISLAAVIVGVRLGQIFMPYLCAMIFLVQRTLEFGDPYNLILDLVLILLVLITVVIYAEWWLRPLARLVRRLAIPYIRPLNLQNGAKRFQWKRNLIILMTILLVLALFSFELTVILIVFVFTATIFIWLLRNHETQDNSLSLKEIDSRIPIVELKEVRLSSGNVGEAVDKNGRNWRAVSIEMFAPARAELKSPEDRNRALYDLLAELAGISKNAGMTSIHLIREVGSVKQVDVHKETAVGLEEKSEVVFLVYEAREEVEEILKRFADKLNWRLKHLSKAHLEIFCQSVFTNQQFVPTMQTLSRNSESVSLKPHGLEIGQLVETRQRGQSHYVGILALPKGDNQAIASVNLDAAWIAAQRFNSRLHLLIQPFERQGALAMVEAQERAQKLGGSKAILTRLAVMIKALLQKNPDEIRQCLFGINVLLEFGGNNSSDVEGRMRKAQGSLDDQRIESRRLVDYQLEIAWTKLYPIALRNEGLDLRQWFVGQNLPTCNVLSSTLADFLFDALGGDTRAIAKALPANLPKAKQGAVVAFVRGLKIGSSGFRQVVLDFLEVVKSGIVLVVGPTESGKTAFFGRLLLGFIATNRKVVLINMEVSEYFRKFLEVFCSVSKRDFVIFSPINQKERTNGWQDRCANEYLQALRDSKKIVVFQPKPGSSLLDETLLIFVQTLLAFTRSRDELAEPIALMVDEIDYLTSILEAGEAEHRIQRQIAGCFEALVNTGPKHGLRLFMSTHSLGALNSDSKDRGGTGLGPQIVGEARQVLFFRALSERLLDLEVFGLSASVCAMILNRTGNIAGLNPGLILELHQRGFVTDSAPPLGSFIWVTLGGAGEVLRGQLILTPKELEIAQSLRRPSSESFPTLLDGKE